VSPEDLNETHINFSHALNRQKNILIKKLGKAKESNGEWDLGFERTFKEKIWITWNTRTNYPTEIANTVNVFKPNK